MFRSVAPRIFSRTVALAFCRASAPRLATVGAVFAKAPVSMVRFFADQAANSAPKGDRAQGTVKWFNATKGFGFITRDSGEGDLFVHFTSVRGEGYRSLEEGQRVEFKIAQGQKGPTASDVTLVQ